MKCSKDVYQQIIESGFCNAITNFKNPYSKKAYKILKLISGMDNFFFTMQDTNTDDIDDILDMSNEQNIIRLTLEVPENITFKCKYYDFTDLIYYIENEKEVDVIHNIIRNIIKNNFPKDEKYIQVIIPYILKEWIISVK